MNGPTVTECYRILADVNTSGLFVRTRFYIIATFACRYAIAASGLEHCIKIVVSSASERMHVIGRSKLLDILELIK